MEMVVRVLGKYNDLGARSALAHCRAPQSFKKALFSSGFSPDIDGFVGWGEGREQANASLSLEKLRFFCGRKFVQKPQSQKTHNNVRKWIEWIIPILVMFDHQAKSQVR